MNFRPPIFLPWIFSGLTWRIPTPEKKVYLTFDDGPVPGPTEFVLETLNQFKAKATFFCIGDNVRKHPQIFKQVVERGHVIGNHTFNHIKGWSTSTNDYVANIEKCETQFNSEGVSRSKLFRPPYGRINFKQTRQLKATYKIIMWDVLTHDYLQSLKPEKSLAGSLKVTRPGSIVVFHDSLKAERTLRYVLPRYLESLVNKGYSFDLIP